MQRYGSFQNSYEYVIPAKAGIQLGVSGHIGDAVLDPGVRLDDEDRCRDDDLLKQSK